MKGIAIWVVLFPRRTSQFNMTSTKIASSKEEEY